MDENITGIPDNVFWNIDVFIDWSSLCYNCFCYNWSNISLLLCILFVFFKYILYKLMKGGVHFDSWVRRIPRKTWI